MSNDSTNKAETVNGLYLFLDDIEDAFPENEIDGNKDYCLIFTKTDMSDTLFYFSYCSPSFPNQNEVTGYKGVINLKELNIMIIDKYDLGIELYKDSLQSVEIFDLKNYKSNFQGIFIGYLQNNQFTTISTSDIIEKGWEKYFFEGRR